MTYPLRLSQDESPRYRMNCRDLKAVCVRTTHIMADGKVIEHWANRDDPGMAR